MKPNQNQYQSQSLGEIPILRLHCQPGWPLRVVVGGELGSPVAAFSHLPRSIIIITIINILLLLFIQEKEKLHYT